MHLHESKTRPDGLGIRQRRFSEVLGLRLDRDLDAEDALTEAALGVRISDRVVLEPLLIDADRSHPEHVQARERPRAPCGFAPPPIRRQPALLADDIDERILDERPPHLRTTSCVMLDRSCPVSMRGFDERLRSIVSWSRGLTGKPADIAFLISPVSHSPSRSSAMSAVIFPATTLRARRCCRLRISLILASIG